MSDRPYISMTLQRQQKASNPRASAWVSAHAGSGKTYVLTQRVLRLLLAGERPSQILCLTFTKAAAANMSTRVFDKLAKWAVLDDAALEKEIEETGADARAPGVLLRARQLFARAVETPGGLKIQTIHAFCEKLLHSFPFESNVPAGFSVLDDSSRAELLQLAKRRTIERAMRETGALSDALAIVAGETAEKGFDDLCNELLTKREALYQAFDRESYEPRLRLRLGLRERETLADVEAEIMETRADWQMLASALREGSKNDARLAAHLERACAGASPRECVDAYIRVFFTDKGAPRGVEKTKIITAGLCKAKPGLLEQMEAERDRLAGLIEKRKAAAVAERSLALVTLGDAIMQEYVASKHYRNQLDYDDLIESARRLLERSDPSWVLYKLDSQIDHILLDEAQDTSARQWEILSAIASEFCAGAGARPKLRTFFAVGDDKQSIFSFQGAAPEKFDEMRRYFEARFRAVDQLFESVGLVESFRSAPGVLAAVDDVFNHADHSVGLFCQTGGGESGLEHEAAKRHVAALVEIWEPIGPTDKQEPEDWRLPLDYASAADPAERLSRKIAEKVSALLAPQSGECVENKKALRRVEARDILVVVRKRGGFFESLIRALKAAGVPVAGADRLDLAKHIAVNDLVALGRVALLVEDDLTLATLLKSPLIGLTDDDLIALAPNRTGSLYEALAASADDNRLAAALRIEDWRRDAAGLPPFEFFSRALGPGGGRRRLVARLGPEANDAIDEFLRLALSFEREQSPSLIAFLAMVETLDLSIKRDMEAAGGAVRVMTAHAAKGLEAKIVFLPDTCGAPSGQHDPRLFTLGEADALSLVWSRGKNGDPAALSAARDAHRDAERAEHRRLLYVALTRAEERLYICGYHGERGPVEGCWHKMIVDALEESCERAEDADGYVLRRGEPTIGNDLAGAAPAASAPETPAFALTPAPKEAAPAAPLRPSSALAGADALAEMARAAPNRRDAAAALAGRLSHSLLQHLPDCAPARRREAATRFVETRGAAIEPETRAKMVESALAVIDDPELAPLFGPQSAAEVDVVASVGQGVSGRIDRLAETETEVLIADFKTGRPRALDAALLRQLALYRAALAPLYPQKRLRGFIVWTRTATAVEAEEAALDEAFAIASR